MRNLLVNRTGQVGIPCVLMRGGTSKGPFFFADDLPSDRTVLERVLLAAMGSPDTRQINGIGGADTLTSKIAIISKSKRADAEIDYLFAQCSVDKAVIDFSPNCGNMLAAVGPYAIETGLVQAQSPTTRVRIHNVNTGAVITATIQTPDGIVNYEGEASIHGVPGTSAPVYLEFSNIVGGKTGKLFPTGKPMDVIDGIEATCIDVAMPMVLMKASDFGISGYESKPELDANKELIARFEQIRRKAGVLMGMGDVSASVVPKVGLLSPPRAAGGTITSRYFVPWNLHAAHAVTGALCLGSAIMLPGTVARQVCEAPAGPFADIMIEHPTGSMGVAIETTGEGNAMTIKGGSFLRTARLLFAGEVFVPASAFGDARMEKAA
ncbi:MAG: 4-oxalomesaconate tautomerase [Burkholderiales bacterium]|nr:4-oxalomesaconate tautomerase [Burkholderiales bacterium]